jgi:hypothetical protein
MTVATVSATAPSVFQNDTFSTLSSSQRSSLNQVYALALLNQVYYAQPNSPAKGYNVNGAVLVPWLGQGGGSVSLDSHGWHDVQTSGLVPASYTGSQFWVPVTYAVNVTEHDDLH